MPHPRHPEPKQSLVKYAQIAHIKLFTYNNYR